MPTSEAPTDVNEPKGPAETNLGPDSPEQGSPASPPQPLAPIALSSGGSRWVDYNTHELLEMISDLEDERRWARLREGVLWAILFHILVLSAVTWIPEYVLKVPKIVDPFDAINKRKDLTYLDLPPDALREIKPKVVPKPVKPQIDQKTLDEMKREANKPALEAPPPPQPAPEPPKQQPSQPIPPSQQAQVEAPRPAAVPARPNFALDSQNPADQLKRDMQNAMKNRGSGNSAMPGTGGLPMHSGTGGGVQVLSDMQGVDFSSWLQRWHYVTEQTWDPLIPDEVNPPLSKQGQVLIRFKVLPNGRLVEKGMVVNGQVDEGMVLEGRSGDTGLDRAAWGALTGSSYPPLPKDFHGPYLELRAWFLYNEEPPR
jgi:outer membrane biosynthesis protein TonB